MKSKAWAANKEKPFVVKDNSLNISMASEVGKSMYRTWSDQLGFIQYLNHNIFQ